MNFFDLHCDTAGECFKQRKALAENDFHISLCKGKGLDKWAQLFAIWITDDLRGKTAESYYNAAVENFRREISQNSEKIKLCKDLHDYYEAINSGRCAAFLTVEGASAVCGEGGLERAKHDGVKAVTLTWNSKNEIACGCQDEENGGFTQRGKSFIRELGEKNIIADVSHLNRKGFYELMAAETDAPIIASHSNSASVLDKTRTESLDKFFSMRRLLEDEQIKLLIERGGLIGLNFCNSFLGDPGDDGFEAVFRHAAKILELGGEDVLAMGSDFDGCDINPELAGLDRIPALYDYFLLRGAGKELAEKIFFCNAEKFFIGVLQKDTDVL